MEQPPISFIGGGNMAASLIGGLVKKGYPANVITASDPLEENRQRLADSFGIVTTNDNLEAVSKAALVVLAVKPQIINLVASEIQPALNESTVVVSIAAGVTLDLLQDWLGDQTPIIRCMPNTPALVQTGATGAYGNPLVSEQQKSLCSEILSAVGILSWVERESDLDIVTAVSGSGPAYFFYMMEIMEKTAREMGLEETTARQLTLQTALGAAKMALTSKVDSAELRRQVTSPKGTTERAIQAFQKGDLEGLVKQAMEDCRDRAVAMAAELAGNT